MSLIESGRMEPYPRQLAKIAKALGVEVAALSRRKCDDVMTTTQVIFEDARALLAVPGRMVPGCGMAFDDADGDAR